MSTAESISAELRIQASIPHDKLRVVLSVVSPANFADTQLLRTGRCHESEIYKAFRKSFAQYRDPVSIPHSSVLISGRMLHDSTHLILERSMQRFEN